MYRLTLLDAGTNPEDQDDIANVYIDGELQSPQFDSRNFYPPYDHSTDTGGKRVTYVVSLHAGDHELKLEVIYSEIKTSQWGKRIEKSPVGGILVPVGKLALLTPYIVLAVTLVAVAIGTVYAGKRWLGNVG